MNDLSRIFSRSGRQVVQTVAGFLDAVSFVCMKNAFRLLVQILVYGKNLKESLGFPSTFLFAAMLTRRYVKQSRALFFFPYAAHMFFSFSASDQIPPDGDFLIKP